MLTSSERVAELKSDKKRGKKSDRPVSVPTSFVVQEAYIEVCEPHLPSHVVQEFVLLAQKEAADMPIEQPTEVTFLEQTSYLQSASIKVVL